MMLLHSIPLSLALSDASPLNALLLGSGRVPAQGLREDIHEFSQDKSTTVAAVVIPDVQVVEDIPPPVYKRRRYGEGTSTVSQSLSEKSQLERWLSSFLPSTLHSGQRLTTGNYLQVSDLILTVQSDCNLVAYYVGRHNKVAAWETNTDGLGKNCDLLLLNNCKLVVRTDTHKTVWSTKATSTNGPCILYLKKDGFSIVDSNKNFVVQQAFP
ncbi:hypothetical protein KSP40_PGU001317 [Platanthera guangdongensis]|uniref:Bulb-type lectin domain-containing protein n=1 Tax=Platanthera guangdongensis TaxID=2320717 RepID=A0ABR2MFW0_9ASPA